VARALDTLRLAAAESTRHRDRQRWEVEQADVRTHDVEFRRMVTVREQASLKAFKRVHKY
jgi:hypothetical protein